LVTGPQGRGVAEDLAQRQVGEQSHGQDEPRHDFVGEATVSAVAAARIVEHLLQTAAADKLLERCQSVQIHLAQYLRFHSHSLPELECVATSSYQMAVTCAKRKRYWA
jgi:hypothetical protein